MKRSLLRLKNKTCQNIKRLQGSFIFFEGQRHIHVSVRQFHATDLLKQYLTSIKEQKRKKLAFPGAKHVIMGDIHPSISCYRFVETIFNMINQRTKT